MSRTYRHHVPAAELRDRTSVRPYNRAAERREMERERAEAMGELPQPVLRRVPRGEQR